MKTSLFLLVILFVLFESCKDNSVNPPFNPLADSTNIKFIYEINDFEVWSEGDEYGKMIVIDFDGNYNSYILICGKNPSKSIYLKKDFQKRGKSLLDSIDNIFNSSNFLNYPEYLPSDLKSSDVAFDVCPSYKISWRANKNIPLTKTYIYDCWGDINHKKTGSFPGSYDYFRTSLNSMFLSTIYL